MTDCFWWVVWGMFVGVVASLAFWLILQRKKELP